MIIDFSFLFFSFVFLYFLFRLVLLKFLKQSATNIECTKDREIKIGKLNFYLYINVLRYIILYSSEKLLFLY